jgi:hypothetical protein
MTHRRVPPLGEIATKPAFRTIDGVSIRFAESDPGNSDALLLSPWPESVFAYEPIWSRFGGTDAPGCHRPAWVRPI